MKSILRMLRIIFAHFQTKLLLAFFLCTLVPLAVIECISYSVSYSIAHDKLLDATLLASDQLHVRLNSRIRQAENVADALQYHIYVLENTDETEISAYLEAFTSMRNNISLYKSTFDFRHICVFLKDGHMGSNEGLFFYPLRSLDDFGLKSDELARLGSSSFWSYVSALSLPYILDTDGLPANTVICCRSMHDQGAGRLDYAYCIIMNTDEFSELFTSSFSGSQITGFLLSQDGTVIAGSGADSGFASGSWKEGDFLPEEAFLSFKNMQNTYEKHGQAYYYVLLLDNGWYQVISIPVSYITGGSMVLLRTILITLFLFLPLTVFVVLLISRNLSRRINLLSRSMEEFRMSQNVASMRPLTIPRPKDPDLYDEIDRLGSTFEHMQETIRQNVSSILDLSLAEEHLKYQLLQSQINPHFLYNILSSIKTCQSLDKLDAADQMITDLTRFYRLTLRKSGELITIRDELEIASLYLDMEKLCHRNALDWEINLEDGIENFLICKFTLQPFLENSILHGMSEQIPNLLLRIKAVYGDDTVIITIEDNGSGIDENKLEELRKNLESKEVNYQKHFGICNVNARISSELYGNGHIKIESWPGRGTRVTLEFLQMEGESE